MFGRAFTRLSGALTRGMASKALTHETMNPRVLDTQYAVRGELVIRAEELRKRLERGDKLPFKKLIMCNIGNPQSLKQKPITFIREVLALCQYPALLDNPNAKSIFAEDCIERARYLLSKAGGMGAYSHSIGVPAVREDVARFIAERDGFPADPEEIYLTDGASPAIQRLLTLMIRTKNDGIMIPIPQYPLYSAAIALNGGKQVGYFLDETNNWSMEPRELRRAVQAARSEGTDVRAMVVINPSNPTGALLSESNIREVIEFCLEERLVLLADEVYQENVYKPGAHFVSFKKVLRSMGEPVASALELASFHTVSKGFIGECGQRGGYAELVNFGKDALAEYYKLMSISLCGNLSGQVTVDCMVNPPRPGQPSYERYVSEREAILSSLRRRATRLTTALNALPGMSCLPAEGAMYAFPTLYLPPRAVAAAQAAGRAPDFFYCLQLLEATGICVVPGSGFGQRDGSYHFRTTFLPPEDEIDLVTERMSAFHADFMARYA